MHSVMVVSVRRDVTGNGSHSRGNGYVCAAYIFYMVEECTSKLYL